MHCTNLFTSRLIADSIKSSARASGLRVGFFRFFFEISAVSAVSAISARDNKSVQIRVIRGRNNICDFSDFCVLF